MGPPSFLCCISKTEFLKYILNLRRTACTVVKQLYSVLKCSKISYLFEKYTWSYVFHCLRITPFAPFTDDDDDDYYYYYYDNDDNNNNNNNNNNIDAITANARFCSTFPANCRRLY